MSEINIRRQHALTLDDARRLAEDMAVRLNERFDLAYRWEGDALRFERDGVHGALVVGHSEIHIRARLSFLLSLAREQIEQQIHSSLDDVFAAVGRAPADSRTTRKTRRKS